MPNRDKECSVRLEQAFLLVLCYQYMIDFIKRESLIELFYPFYMIKWIKYHSTLPIIFDSSISPSVFLLSLL